MRSTFSQTFALALALLAGVCAACSSRGNHADDPPTEPKDVTAMTPAERYAGYLAGFGITPDRARVIAVPDLTIGAFEFFQVDAAGTSGGLHKAAASPSGLVAGGARPADAWHAFLSAAPPDVVARRIAWLETDDRIDPHRRYPKLLALAPADRPGVTMDPSHWALVTAPATSTEGDAVVFTGWFLASGQQVPLRWRISARPSGPAVIEKRSADVLAPAQDPIARARALLSAGSAQDRRWALTTLGDARHTAAVPAMVPLLADPDPDVRDAAASALGRIGDPAAIPHLRDAFQRETDRGRRASLVAALAAFGDAAVADLGRLVAAERERDVRLEIVHALARIRSPAARAVLKERAAKDGDPDVRKLAATYMQTLD